jgi:phytanoyl-CoA hydroxylase
MREHLDAHQDTIHAPALKKGDVLFWNSRTVHGSLETTDERYSRKSLTAHYLPSDLTFGNLFTEKPWVQYKEWDGQRYFANQPEYSLKADLVTRAKVAVYDNPALLKLARKFQKRSLADIDS